MEIRPYRAEDRPSCLALFDPHVPASFAPKERADFERFLDDPPPTYYVADHEGAVLGCGGHAGERICWLIIAREHQGRGVGRFLMMYLLREIGRLNLPVSTLGTTPNVVGFYEKLGYRVTDRVPDGYAPGYDRMEMVKKLTVCS